MVNSVCIEIAGHHLQAALPPSVAVLGHRLPVVGREAPVLSFGGEVIWRGTNLHVKVEQIGMRFHVHSRRIHPDGDIALQQQSLVVQGLDGLAQLLVAVVLKEEMDLCAVTITLGAILGVVMEPVFVFFDELFESRCGFQRFPLLIESGLEVFPFGFQHFGIIDRFFLVEHCPHPFEGRVFQNAQLLEIEVNRVQRKSRNGIIRIGIAPIIMRRRVVDGQDLDDFHAVGHAPIAQFGQVGIFADAEIIFCT